MFSWTQVTVALTVTATASAPVTVTPAAFPQLLLTHYNCFLVWQNLQEKVMYPARQDCML